MSNEILSFNDLKDRVWNKQAANNPDDASDIKDPNDAGTKAIPTDPDNKNSTKSLPENKKNDEGDPEALTHGDTTEAGDGKTPTVAKTENKGGCGTEDVTKAASNLLNKLTNKSAKKTEETTKQVAKDVTVVKDEITAVPEIAKKAEETKSAEEKAGEVKWDRESHIKLAEAILSDEENFATADRLLKRKLGADAANDLLKAASESMAAEKEEQAQSEFVEYMEKYATAEEKQQLHTAIVLDNFEKTASAEDKQKFEKIATAYNAGLATCTTDMEKKAFEQGAQDAALGMEAGMDAPVEEGMPAGGELTPEDLVMLIMAAVESGEIPEEVAMQLIEAIEGGGELAPEEGGAPMEEDPAAIEAAMAAEGGEPKMASLNEKLAAKLVKTENK